MTKIIDKTVDFIFSRDERKWLILILLLGVILRFIVSSNVSALGDEAVHGPHAIGFLHSGLISTILHSPLWFYLTDIFFKILGVTIFSTRFLSFFYGSLSIILIYLIGSKIFNRKAGLISAFLFSVSYLIIRYTLAEMDLTIIFFLLIAMYSFMKDTDKNKFPWLSAVCIGLAALVKTLSLFFVPAFLIGFFLFNKKQENEDKRNYVKRNIKNIFLFGLIILLFFSPILIHNYLWYEDKGMVDWYFAQYFNVESGRQVYQIGAVGYDADTAYYISKLPEWIPSISKFFIFSDPIITIFSLLGVALLFIKKRQKDSTWFIILFNLSGLIFLLISTGLQTHYTTMIPVLCIFAGFFIEEISNKFKNINPNKILAIAFILILIFQIYLLIPHLTSKCGICKMREYAIDNMDKNSIVVADARIYRGRIVWLFNDFHYLESSYLSQILDINKNLSGQDIPIKLYFVECARDDCGWGTIKDQPDFNKSMEEIVSSISSITSPEKVILGGGGYDEETGTPYIKVYQTVINLKPQIISVIDSTHDWFYYPVDYKPKEKIFDTYEVKGFLNNLIYLFAWAIIISSIILAILFSIIPFIEVIKQNEKNETFSNNSSI